MNRPSLASILCLLAASVLQACSATRPVEGPPVGPSNRQVRAVAPPPGVEARHIAPLSGKALVKANFRLDQIAAELVLPRFLRHPATKPAVGEPALKAQLAYAQGRADWLDGHRMRAIEHFQSALRLAPGSAEILRTLGLLWIESGNPIRGSDYLKKAVARNPGDLRTLLLLGRIALNRSDWSGAAAIFHTAMRLSLDQPAGDPALGPLLHYDLAIALRHTGYLAAATMQYQHYFASPRDFIRPSAFGQQLLYIDQQQGVTWQTLGDLYNRLNNPADALAAYHEAEKAGVSDSADLLKRRIYTQLRLGQSAIAEQLTIELIRRSHNDDDALAMIRYLAAQGVSAADLASRLERLYRAQGRPANLVKAIAHLLPPAQARALLIAHLKARPADQSVFQSLIADYLLPANSPQPSLATLGQAVQVTAAEIAGDAPRAEQYAVVLVTHIGDPDRLVEAIGRWPRARRREPIIRVIAATAYAAANQLDQAVSAYRAALKSDPHLAVTRVGLARVLIYQKHYQQAATVLQPLAGSADPRIVHLRVRIFIATGNKDKALALLDRLIHADATPVNLVLQKARLQIQLSQTEKAAQTLRDALNAHPDDQRIYAALFNLYDSNSYAGDSVRGYEQLMQRMLGNIPHSRIAKLKLAELHAVRGETRQAQALLTSLLEQNDADLDAVKMLADVYQKAGERDKAVKLLTKTINAHPRNQALLVIAQRFYVSNNDRDRLLQVTARLLALQPPSPQKALATARLYLNAASPRRAADLLDRTLRQHHDRIKDPEPFVSLLWQALLQLHQPTKARRRIEEAIRHFPHAQANLHYELAMFYSQQGDQAQSDRVLEALLKGHPDHGPANNALGYSWAQQNKNLPQAEKLVTRALKKNPRNPAYLDSLGWVLYKMGRFDHALRQFKLAVRQPGGQNPVILDHYGDTAYRAGHQRQALRVWRQALGLYLSAYADSNDSEMIGLNKKLEQKINAVRKHGKPILPTPTATTPTATTPTATTPTPTTAAPAPTATTAPANH